MHLISCKHKRQAFLHFLHLVPVTLSKVQDPWLWKWYSHKKFLPLYEIKLCDVAALSKIEP